MSEVKSPCVSICALDEADICMGCYRSLQEITEWCEYSDDQRLLVLKRADGRCREKYQLG